MQYFLLFSHKMSRYITAKVGLANTRCKHQDLWWSKSAWVTSSLSAAAPPLLQPQGPLSFLILRQINEALTRARADVSDADCHEM